MFCLWRQQGLHHIHLWLLSTRGSDTIKKEKLQPPINMRRSVFAYRDKLVLLGQIRSTAQYVPNIRIPLCTIWSLCAWRWCSDKRCHRLYNLFIWAWQHVNVRNIYVSGSCVLAGEPLMRSWRRKHGRFCTVPLQHIFQCTPVSSFHGATSPARHCMDMNLHQTHTLKHRELEGFSGGTVCVSAACQGSNHAPTHKWLSMSLTVSGIWIAECAYSGAKCNSMLQDIIWWIFSYLAASKFSNLNSEVSHCADSVLCR